VTKRGGLLAYVTNPNFSGEAQISAETAVKIAAKYLGEIGYADMKAGYYSTYDGVCTVVFHYSKDDVVYYADLIKVGVALDTAHPVALDARGYLMNHTARKLPETTYTAAQAAAALAPALKLLGTKTVLVPSDDGTEQLCHELHCRDESGQEVLLYTSVTTGEEVDLKILLYADGGVLAK
jgi:germination protein YpeB